MPCADHRNEICAQLQLWCRRLACHGAAEIRLRRAPQSCQRRTPPQVAEAGAVVKIAGQFILTHFSILPVEPLRMPTVAVTDYTFPSLDIEEAILRPLGVELIHGQCKTAEA